jgi:hypothetical protein
VKLKWNVTNKQLSIAFGIFVLLTASNFSILADQSIIDVQKLRQFDFSPSMNTPSMNTPAVGRNPASVQTPISAPNKEDSSPVKSGESFDFEFGCDQKVAKVTGAVKSQRNVASVKGSSMTLYGKALDERAKIQVKNSLVLMKGKICLKGGMLIHRVKNFTNGFTASVFAKGTQSFQTDFIQLNQGINEVIFEFKNSSGEKKQEKVFVQFDQI